MRNQLIVSKDKFKADLQLRIERGQEILADFPLAITEEKFLELRKNLTIGIPTM